MVVFCKFDTQSKHTLNINHGTAIWVKVSLAVRGQCQLGQQIMTIPYIHIQSDGPINMKLHLSNNYAETLSSKLFIFKMQSCWWQCNQYHVTSTTFILINLKMSTDQKCLGAMMTASRYPSRFTLGLEGSTVGRYTLDRQAAAGSDSAAHSTLRHSSMPEHPAQ